MEIKKKKKQQRTTDDLRKALKEQSNCFKILHKKLEEKTQQNNELQREILILKYNIKCLEKENIRLKYDKRRNA